MLLRENDLKLRIKLNNDAFNEATKMCVVLTESLIQHCEAGEFEVAQRLAIKIREHRIKRVGFAKVALELKSRLDELSQTTRIPQAS